MNARHIIIAAALACFGLAAHSLGTAGFSANGSRLSTAALAAPPLNIKAEPQKTSRKAAGKASSRARKTQASKPQARKTQTSKARTSKPHRIEQAAETSAPETDARQMQEQIPVIAVKTTREAGDGMAIVDAGEVNELDRAAAPDISLAAYSIMSYLGGAAAIEPGDDTAASTDGADVAIDASDARNSYASTTPPSAPANHIALEYVLMTFACALAAAAAVRVFVV